MGSIRFDNVNKMFGAKSADVKVLDDINLEIADKEFVAIVGPSGLRQDDLPAYRRRLRTADVRHCQCQCQTCQRAGAGPRRGIPAFCAVSMEKTVRQNIDLGLRNKKQL